MIRRALAFVPPYDWDEVQRFFAARAMPGVEVVTADAYARTIEVGGAFGTVSVARANAAKPALRVAIRHPEASAIAPAVVLRLRRMFDLDADVGVIGAALGKDALLRPLVAARPGLRVPGAWDSFELAVRAILGQQVTVSAARALAGKLVLRYGRPFDGGAGLTHLFPQPAALAALDDADLGMPRARVRAIAGLARAVVANPELLAAGITTEALKELPGIGEWTAQYIALRALRDPDAFPASDIGILRGAAENGVRPSPAALLARAEAWRPWRTYAAQHLWCEDAARQ